MAESSSNIEEPRVLRFAQIRLDTTKRATKGRYLSNRCRCAAFQYYSAMCSHPFYGPRYHNCGLSRSRKHPGSCTPRSQLPVVDVKDVLVGVHCKKCYKKNIGWSGKSEDGSQVDYETEKNPSDLEAEQRRLFEGARLRVSISKENELSPIQESKETEETKTPSSK